MSPSDPPPLGPSKGPGAPKGWRGKTRPGSDKRWRWQRGETSDKSRGQQALRWRIKLAAAAAFFVVLLGALIVWLMLNPPPTPVVALVVTDYGAPVPPNAWALEDAEALEQHEELDVATVRPDREFDKSRLLAALKQELQASGQSPARLFWGKPPLILYVSMHGIVDGDGNACLLPPGEFAPDDADWLKVSDVLALLGDLAQGRPKLLVLDCTRIDTQWQLGVLYNGFPEALEAAVAAAAVPNLTVLIASGPGQRAWDSPELGQSVFGYFFFKGLQQEQLGRAKRVHLRALVDYLKENVDHWVRQNRGANQVPMVLAGGKVLEGEAVPDIPLVWVPKHVHEPRPAALERFDDDLNSFWDEHERQRQGGPYRYNPLGWQEFERLLLRLEQLNRAGKAYQDAASDTRRELQNWVTHWTQSPWRAEATAGLVAHSWPMARQLGLVSADNRDLAQATDEWQNLIDHPGSPAARAVYQSGRAIEKQLHAGDLERHFARMLDDLLDAGAWADAGRAAEMLRTAEDAAATGDERAQYWTRSLVEAGDQKRRAAEDRLFVGNTETRAQASDLWGSANAEYSAATKLRTLVQSAYGLRDEVLAELPYYARWCTRRLPRGMTRDPNDVDGVVTLIEQVRALTDALVPGGALTEQGRARGDRLQQAYDGLQGAFKALQSDFEAHLARATQSEDQTALREAAAALELPMVSGATRRQLRDHYNALALQFEQNWRPPEGAWDAEGAALDNYLGEVKQWKQHPAPLLVGHAVDDGSAEEVSSLTAESDEQLLRRLAAAGRNMRRWLYADLDARIGRHLAETDQLLESTEALPEKARAGRSSAARMARGVSALRRPSGPDPVAALRNLDQHNLLMWYARRAADDFWGPVAGAPTQFFFKLAADHYYNAAAQLQKVAADTTLLGRLKTLRQAGLDIQAPANRPTAQDILLLDQDENRIAHGIALHPPASLPDEQGAVAAVYVAKSDDASLSLFVGQQSMKRIPVSLEPSSAEINYQLSVDELGDTDRCFTPVWLFRGHQAKGSFSWKREPLFILTYQPPKLLPPTILVNGPAAGGAVSFILDCSRSMSRTLIGPEGRQSTLMEVAASTLKSLLEMLAANGNYEVAVRLYGHRAEWSGVSLQPTFNPAFPDHAADLIPPYDVQLVLPMGPFGPDSLKQITPILERAGKQGAWGQTPLYRALYEALTEDFRNQPKDKQKIIVVITDGANFQTGPAGFQRHDKDDVMNAWNARRDVAIYGVEFKVQLITPQDKQELQRFRDIVRDTSGRDTLAADNEQQLRDALALQFQYQVVPPKGDVRTQPFGRAVQNIDAGDGYQVRLEADHAVRKQFDLEDGRDLELRVTDDRQRLLFSEFLKDPDDRGNPEFVDATANGRHFRVGFHTPHSEPNAPSTVRFRFSVQDADGQFTRRPAQVWTEIQPVTREGRRGRVYPFYHAEWVDRRPVPVWDCVVPDWPKGVRRAEVHFWLSFGDVLPEQPVQSVAQLERNPDGLKVGSATFQVQRKQGRVQVIERHDPARTLFEQPMKVALHPPQGPLRAVIRRRYYENGQAVHMFLFDQGVSSDAMAAYELQIIKRESIEKAGLQCSHTFGWELDPGVGIE